MSLEPETHECLKLFDDALRNDPEHGRGLKVKTGLFCEEGRQVRRDYPVVAKYDYEAEKPILASHCPFCGEILSDEIKQANAKFLRKTK